MSLFGKCKQVCQGCSKCLTDAVQVRNVVTVDFFWDIPKGSAMECAFCHQARFGARQVETYVQEHDSAYASFGLLLVGLLCQERSSSLRCKIPSSSLPLLECLSDVGSVLEDE